MKWLFFLLPVVLLAQSPAPLNADYRFHDGVYLSHASLLADQPDVDWADIAGEMVQLTEDRRVQIDAYGYKSGQDHGRPYAIVLDGAPYLFVGADARRGFYEFAGLRSPGRLATVTFDTTVHLRRIMKAYNPATGNPFRQGWVERDQRRTVTRVVDMQTGVRRPLEPDVVANLLAGEADLLRAVRQTTAVDTAKLLRAVEIYNERHPLLLPVTTVPR